MAARWNRGLTDDFGDEPLRTRDLGAEPGRSPHQKFILTVHYGSRTANGGSTGNWSTLPQGWAGAGAIYGTPDAGVPNVRPGWNVVDIEFTSTVANVYFNGKRYITIPASALSHKPAYLNFGISGPNGTDPNNATWPAGHGTEDVQYVKVFS
jgi:hypothetical protein